MAWLRHTWRTLSRRHVALPAVVIFGPILAVALVAALVVNATTGDAEESSAPTETTGATPDTTYLADLPPSCVEPEGATCSLRTGALALVAETGDVELQADGAVGVEGDLAIPTAGGDVELIDSDLVIEVDDDGEIVDIDGTAEAPLPDFGALSGAVLLEGARAEVGYDWGRDLADLGAHLQPDRQYYWFTFESTWAMSTGFDEVVGDAAALPVSLSTPGDVSVTMVLDPTDPYFYIGGPCPSYDSGSNGNDGSGGNGGNGRSSDGDSADLTVGEVDGEDCGLGVSQEGNIPFEARTESGAGAEFQSFDGHIVVDHSEIPLYKGIFLDGSAVIRLSEFLALGGNGDVFLGVPVGKFPLDVNIPVGNATVGQRYPNGVTGGTADLFLAGLLDSDIAADELPAWFPVEPAQEAEVRASARIVADAGVVVVDDSFVQLTGELRTLRTFLSELTALTINPIESFDSLFRIDAEGIRLNGSAVGSIHPAIDVGGTLTVDGVFDPVEPEASHYTLSGTVGVGGVLLDGDTTIRLDSDGGTVAGSLSTPLSTIALSGALTDDDILLRGSTQVEASTADLAAPVDRARQLVDDARAALDEVDAVIEETREGVRQAREVAVAAAEQSVADAERLRDNVSQQLSSASDDLDDLQRDLRGVLGDIADALGIDIDEVEDVAEILIPRALRDERDRIEDLIDDAEDQVDDLGDDLSRAVRQVRTATAALTALVEEHAEIAVDEVGEVAELLAERPPFADALTDAEQTASALSGAAAFDVDVQLGTAGLSGDVSGEVCSDDACVDVSGGSVRFDDAPEACFTMVGVETCVPF